MKLRLSLAAALPALTLLAASVQAAEQVPPLAPVDAAPANAAPADAPAAGSAVAETAPEDPNTYLAIITPRLFAFDYFDGVGADKTHYLERYDYRESFGGDIRDGAYADLDLDITGNDSKRDFFVLERRGFGHYNHRGEVKYSNDSIKIYGSYSRYRSATGGIDYLFSPGQVVGGTASVDGGGSGGGGGGPGGGGGGGGGPGGGTGGGGGPGGGTGGGGGPGGGTGGGDGTGGGGGNGPGDGKGGGGGKGRGDGTGDVDGTGGGVGKGAG